MAFILVVNSPVLSGINQLCKVHLERAGHTVTSAEDGNVATELVQSMTFDLVMSALNVPGSSGLQLYGKIRADPRTKDTPFILFPMKHNHHTSEEAREINSALLLRHAPLHKVFFLVSPFNPNNMVAFVGGVLSGHVSDGTFYD